MGSSVRARLDIVSAAGWRLLFAAIALALLFRVLTETRHFASASPPMAAAAKSHDRAADTNALSGTASSQLERLVKALLASKDLTDEEKRQGLRELMRDWIRRANVAPMRTAVQLTARSGRPS